MESSGQSQWELVSVVDNKERGSHLRSDRLRLQNVDIVDKVRSAIVNPRRACVARVTLLGFVLYCLSFCVSIIPHMTLQMSNHTIN